MSVGLSDNDRMSRTSVIECVLENGIKAHTSFTSDRTSPRIAVS